MTGRAPPRGWKVVAMWLLPHGWNGGRLFSIGSYEPLRYKAWDKAKLARQNQLASCLVARYCCMARDWMICAWNVRVVVLTSRLAGGRAHVYVRVETGGQ